MPAISNIVVADSVPTNHTYYPRQASMAMSAWTETSAPIFEGNARLAAVMSPPTASRKTTRTKFTHTIPVYRENAEGLFVVSDVMIFTTEGVLPTGLTAVEALNGWTQHKNLQGSSIAQAYFASADPAY